MTSQHPETDRLPEYLTGRLGSEDEAMIAAHLKGCVDCRRSAADLEIGLAALAMVRDEMAAGADADAGADLELELTDATDEAAATAAPAPAPRRSWGRIAAISAGIAAATAGVLAIGGAIGAAVERSNEPEVVAQFVLVPAPSFDAAAGTADLSVVDSGLVIGLDLDALPTDAEYFECLWISSDGSEVRSAGTFLATDGTADVDLVVAPFQQPGWTLEVNAMRHGEAARTVLTATV